MALYYHETCLVSPFQFLDSQTSHLHPLYLLLQLKRVRIVGKSTTPISISKLLLTGRALIAISSHSSFVSLLLISLPLISTIKHGMYFELSLGHVRWWLWTIFDLFGLVHKLLVKSDINIIDGHGWYVLFPLLLAILLNPPLVHHYFLLLYHLHLLLFELYHLRCVLLSMS